MLSKEPSRTDLSSRECAKLICGLLSGLVPQLDEEDALEFRNGLGSIPESSWGQSVALRMSFKAVSGLIVALEPFVKDDPEQLKIAIQWIMGTDEVWRRLSA